MNPVLFATILIRVLAIYLVVQGILRVSEISTILLSLLGQRSPEATGYYWYFSVVYLFLPILAGLLLCALTKPIARLLVGKGAALNDATPLSIETVTGAAIAVAGLLITVFYLANPISAVLFAFGDLFASGSMHWGPRPIEDALRVVLGLVLLVGVRKWVRLIARLRGFAPDR